jgi:hypothetical protein
MLIIFPFYILIPIDQMGLIVSKSGENGHPGGVTDVMRK